MRVSIGVLRSLVREAIIMERPMNAIDTNGMALMLSVMADEIRAVLYKQNEMTRAIVAGEGPERLVDHIVATIKAKKIGDHHQLDSVAALKGWGPMMYDIAMANSPNGLVPDRNSVSPSAERVWQRYQTRDDVKKKDLHPGTTRMHSNPILNVAYSLKNRGPNTDALEDAHAQVENDTDYRAAAEIEAAARKFFQKMM